MQILAYLQCAICSQLRFLIIILVFKADFFWEADPWVLDTWRCKEKIWAERKQDSSDQSARKVQRIQRRSQKILWLFVSMGAYNFGKRWWLAFVFFFFWKSLASSFWSDFLSKWSAISPFGTSGPSFASSLPSVLAVWPFFDWSKVTRVNWMYWSIVCKKLWKGLHYMTVFLHMRGDSSIKFMQLSRTSCLPSW